MRKNLSGRLLSIATQATLWLVLLYLAYFVVGEVWSIAWGMATGNHFQAYAVDFIIDQGELTMPDVTDPLARVRGLRVGMVGEVAVDFDEGWSSWLAWHGVDTALVGLSIGSVAWWLLRIVRSAAGGEPLSTLNAARLRWIGWVALVTPLARTAVDLYSPSIIDGLSATALFRGVWGLPLYEVATGLVLLVLARIWRQAAEIRAEHALTV